MGRRSFLCTAAALGVTWRGDALTTPGPVEQNSSERYPEPLGWKPHFVKQRNNSGDWRLYPAEFRLLYRAKAVYTLPFGLVEMDNGEIALIGSCRPEGQGFNGPFGFVQAPSSSPPKERTDKPVIAFSRDGGNTWSNIQDIEATSGRPIAPTYVGKGKLMFQGERHVQCFSEDYGRTWEQHPLQPFSNGQPFNAEGNFLVDRDARGIATRIGAIGWFYENGRESPRRPAYAGLRWSTDGGRTWTKEVVPETWQWDDEYQGKKYRRGVSEGSLVRAANGWLVAALRTDMPARYLDYENEDSLEGTAVSISKDDGQTWSPLRFLFEGGRHHAHLLRMLDGALVMSLIVRVDIQDKKLASYRRGCEAVISRDNGQTWNLGRKYVLDEFEFLNTTNWYRGVVGHLSSLLLKDGRILTAYGKFVEANLMRWKPA